MTITPRLWLCLLAVVALSAIAAFAADRAFADGEQPAFLFPWQDGQNWKTGAAGYHYSNDALDFFPPDTDDSWEIHCEGDPDWVFQESAYWVLASAPGIVTYAEPPYVLIDHGGGWFSRYYHLSAAQVAVGQTVPAGTRLGHPSTRGDCTTGPHVHFWVQGPSGETTQNVSLSGIATTNLGVNESHSQTYNYDPGGPTPTLTPTPTTTPEPTPTLPPTITPTPGLPTPTPEPIPGIFAAGDANCDGLLTPADAILILQFAAGITSSDCAATHSETDCDGTVTVADAMTVLLRTLEPAAAPAKACDTSTPRLTSAPTTDTPTPEPTVEPTPTATPETTDEATTEPTLVPTDTPVATDTPAPTESPVATETPVGPTARPTQMPGS
jgi:hypothetical protein